MLIVDVGNSTTRIAAFSGHAIRARRVFPTRDLEVDPLMRALQEQVPQADSQDVWIASVAPYVNALIDSAAERSGLRRHFIKATDPILPHALTTPESTGVDRLLSALAAGVRHYPGNGGGKGYVVVQCGSAATVDLVDGTGVFRGGYILPGPSFWLAGLSGGAMLPDLSNHQPDWKMVSVGDNTRDAILHGMHLALPVAVASTAMLLNTVEEDVGESLPVAVTGGWGDAAAMYIRSANIMDPDLLLHGIRIFAERNS